MKLVILLFCLLCRCSNSQLLSTYSYKAHYGMKSDVFNANVFSEVESGQTLNHLICANLCAKTSDCGAFGTMFDDANGRICKLATVDGLFNNGSGDLEEVFVDASIDLPKAKLVPAWECDWLVDTEGVSEAGVTSDSYAGSFHTRSSCVQACLDLNDNRNGMTFVPSQGNCFCWTGVSQTKSYATLEFAFINTCSEIMVEASTTTSTTTTTITVTTTTEKPSMVNQWTCDWQDQTDGVIVPGVTNDQFTGTGLTKSKCVQSCADLSDGRNGITFVPSQGNCFCWIGVSQIVSSTVADFAYMTTCSAVLVPATTTTTTTTTAQVTTASNSGTTAAGNSDNVWTCDWQAGTEGVSVDGVTSDQFTGTGLTKSACVQSCFDLTDGRNGVTFVPGQGNCFCWIGVSTTMELAVTDFTFLDTCT